MRRTALIFAVVMLVAVASAYAGTSLSGSLAGAWTFNEDNTASALAAGLGATYRPDVVVAPTAGLKGSFKIQPSDLAFITQQYFNDAGADLNLTGMEISIVKAQNFELLAGGAAVFKGIGSDLFRVGVAALADCRFTSMGQAMAVKFGGGYDGTRPLMILSLGFETK